MLTTQQQQSMANLSEELREIVIKRKESEKLRSADCAAAVMGVLLDVIARAFVTEGWAGNTVLMERYDTIVSVARRQLPDAINACRSELAAEEDGECIRE